MEGVCKSEKEIYGRGGGVYSKQSKLKEDLARCQKQTLVILEIINRLTEIKVDDTMNSFALSRSYLRKAEVISQFLTASATLSAMINDRSLKYSLNRRISQQQKNASSYTTISKRREDELFTFICENNSQLTWAEAFDTLTDMQNSNTNKFPIDIPELIRVAKILSNNIVSHRVELEISTEAMEAIIMLFPVIYIFNSDIQCFINIHEFVYSPVLFLELFLPQEEANTPDPDNVCPDNSDSTDSENKSKGKGGQPSLVSKFPEIVDITTEFIKQHGFAAQCRRRSETGNSSGVTASQIREHLYSVIPELRNHSVSISTIHRLFQAPNKHFKAQARYKGYIDARVGVKSNSYREYHQDAHYLFARNKYRRELASLFSKEIGILSIDDMSKIKVGAPAVSRYHQVKTYFPVNDQPNLKDHDFPVPGYLLGTSGYMFLEPTTDQNFAETLLSLYDQECTVIDNDSFKNMEANGVKGTLYDVLVHQMKVHLNVTTTSEEIKDEIRRKAATEDDIDVLLTTAASLFLTNIVVFHGAGEHSLIAANKSIEGPLYIFKHEDATFESVSFKNEIIDPFNVINGLDQQRMEYDNLGRAHLSTPHSGPSSLFVRSSKYNHSTISTHITDLYLLLKSEIDASTRNSFMFISDGGPDFNPSSVLNQLFLYRLFKRLGLDFLSVFTYAARYSAFNPIEHLWSVMSNKLSGMLVTYVS